MTIREMIVDDHKKIKEILKKLLDSSDTAVATRRKNFIELKSRIEAHSHAEEDVVYARASHESSPKKSSEFAKEGKEEHHVVEGILRELSWMEPSNQRWIYKVRVLKELLEHHINEEENEFLPAFVKHMSDEEQQLAASEFEARKEEYLSGKTKANVLRVPVYPRVKGWGEKMREGVNAFVKNKMMEFQRRPQH